MRKWTGLTAVAIIAGLLLAVTPATAITGT